MTPEEQDAAWAEMEADAAMIGLRSAAERALRALAWVARAGGDIERSRYDMIAFIREADEQARAIHGDASLPGAQTRFAGPAPRGLA
ncbi:hypothetical protein EJV46_05885 [Roseococcus sp. SYP-B2431]|uniref:hypothetical protein n=1 Tax=Roseococcus sp. SYP-B2431 TaxID=2496640 RepID=UPI00103A2833|nr:hypothetical protein [Roseococcus sp. SYP-B2431]TCI00180.1 hypothetical protein EJV46_05885 [Roseococcus sp. SYP-B2431]